MGLQVLKELKGHKVLQVIKELLVIRVHKVLQDLLVIKELKVQQVLHLPVVMLLMEDMVLIVLKLVKTIVVNKRLHFMLFLQTLIKFVRPL